ncbi:MAG TPA: amino acid adenylation domain-containing protein, partial [Longimicrobium sp.]|nr:amino acid adenylation domain-containing protein [Longimicrobium sp.]
YSAFARGEPSPLAPLPLRYADYAVWQRGWLRGEVLEAQLAYWRARLAGAAPLELPTDRPRAAVQAHRGAVHRFALPAGLATSLKALARREGVTPFILLLAAFQAVLGRWSGQDDVVVGTPIANRTRRELEPLVGLFANTLALRADLGGNPTFRELLKRVRETTLDAYAHQDLPFEKLVEELRVERDLSRSPLVQVMFSFQSAGGGIPPFAGLGVTPVRLEGGTAKLDLLLAMYETPEGMGGALEYDSDLLDGATAERLVGHLRVLLEAAEADPGLPLARLPIATAEERRTVVERWNATAVEYPQAARIHSLFEARAASAPAATALSFEGERISYGELDARANRLARHLARHGVGPETRVGVCMERSVEMVVSLLAILKAGGAYVPLDPGYPAERLAYMLGDSAVPVLLVQQRLAAILPPGGARVIAVDAGWPEIARESAAPFDGGAEPDSLAYVIYTSGSTGQPKGVMNSHRGVRNRLLWMHERYALRVDDRVLQKTPFSFDVSVWEFFWPLLAGATLVIARPGGHRDAGYVAELIATERITVAHFVPSMLRVFLDEPNVERCSSLRMVFCSGEALPLALQESFLYRLRAELHNLYGPTEAAVDVTHWACRADPDAHTVPIGAPVANTTAYVLDRGYEPVPIGLAGELYLGGVQVARGYLNRPALTAANFVPDPFSTLPGARLYQTGDRARWRADGALEFLGRLDFQVKVRGFRIEPGEIESVLVAHPAVREAVVTARDDTGETRLVAYVTGHGGPPDPGELRRFLRERLPEHMVPAAFVALDALPLSPSGKVDRRALPAPEAAPAGAHPALPPATELERRIAEAWSEVLAVKAAGVEDNFFDLGGHSLLLARVHRRLAEWAPALTVLDLFQYPTIRSLARFIERGDEEVPAAPAEGRGELRGRQRDQQQRRRQAAALPGEP